MKIAIIDIRDYRRARLVKRLEEIDTNCVFGFAEIPRDEFENGGFNVALVHENNREGALLLNDVWKSSDVSLIFFSGGNSEAISRDGEFVFVSEEELFKRLPDLDHFLSFEP